MHLWVLHVMGVFSMHKMVIKKKTSLMRKSLTLWKNIPTELTDFFSKNPEETGSSQAKFHSIPELTLCIFPMSLYKTSDLSLPLYINSTFLPHRSWLFVMSGSVLIFMLSSLQAVFQFLSEYPLSQLHGSIILHLEINILVAKPNTGE